MWSEGRRELDVQFIGGAAGKVAVAFDCPAHGPPAAVAPLFQAEQDAAE